MINSHPFSQNATCCAGEAAAHSAASSAGTLHSEGTSPPVCPAGSSPAGWIVDTGAAAGAGDPRGKSPAPSGSCWDSENSKCAHMECPWVWGGAAGKCDRPTRRPPRFGTRTDGCPDPRAVGRILYIREPRRVQQRCWWLWFLLQPLSKEVQSKSLLAGKQLWCRLLNAHTDGFQVIISSFLKQNPFQNGKIKIQSHGRHLVFILNFCKERNKSKVHGQYFSCSHWNWPPPQEITNPKKQQQYGSELQLLPPCKFPEGQWEFLYKSAKSHTAFSRKSLNSVKWGNKKRWTEVKLLLIGGTHGTSQL